MTTENLELRQVPWPGPRPYEVREGNMFFGRDAEIEELRRMILRQQLTILSAESGSGKTSLLRAGVVYRLAEERKIGSRTRVKPIVLLREWGGGQRVDVEQLFNHSLDAAVQSVSDYAYDDAAALSSLISTESSFVNNVVKLCGFAEGMVLIFDQFEEVLRRGEEVAREAIDQILKIYRIEPRVKIVLSLRSEYHSYLRDLEAVVSGMYSRTFFLKPMVALSVFDALKKSAQTYDVEMSEKAMKRVILLLIGAHDPTSHLYKEDTEIDSIKDQKVDLLTLQAILLDLYDFSRQRSTRAKKVTIGAPIVQEYIGDRTASKVVEGAFLRWIDRGLERALGKTDHLTPEICEGLSAEEITGIVIRIAARMPQYLASGGYKVSAEEANLMFFSLRDDFSRVRPNIEDTEIPDWKIISDKPIRLDRGRLGLETLPIGDNLSGLARQNKWSPAETADNLADLFFETLYRLQAANILKPIQVRNVQQWELVHDGIGNPFASWGEKNRDTWEDCVHSLTASKGVDIVIPEEPSPAEIVRNLCWNGCFISPRGNPKLIEYEFTDCDLRGTIFQGCTFHGGKFSGCAMDGCLFIDCKFEPGEHGNPVIFDGCTADGLTFWSPADVQKSEIASVNFVHCRVRQLNLTKVTLAGDIVFGDGTFLALCRFSELQAKDPAKPAKVVFNGCKLFYSVWDKQSRRLLDFYDLTAETGNGLLEGFETVPSESRA